MAACSFLGVELSLYEGPQWWIYAIVWWCRQRKERPLCLDSKERHELLSKVRRVSQLREWLRRVSAGAIAYLPHIYLSRLFFCLHLIITRLLSLISFFLSFFFSFFFIWSISWLPEEVDVTRFFWYHKTGKFCSSLVGNSFNIAVL